MPFGIGKAEDEAVLNQELQERGRKALYDDMKAKKQKLEDDARSLRVGEYLIAEERGGQIIEVGSPRPFVYVPEGFDLTAQGAIGQVLEALGISKALDQAAPSMVLRVSKATRPRPVTAQALRGGPGFQEFEEAVAEREQEALALRGEVARLRDELLAAEEAGDDESDPTRVADARETLALAEERYADSCKEVDSIEDEYKRALVAAKDRRDAAMHQTAALRQTVSLDTVTLTPLQRKFLKGFLDAKDSTQNDYKLLDRILCKRNNSGNNSSDPTKATDAVLLTIEQAEHEFESKRSCDFYGPTGLLGDDSIVIRCHPEEEGGDYFGEGDLLASGNDLFKIVDGTAISIAQAKLREQTKLLTRAVLHCSREAGAIIHFTHARRENPQLDLFDDARGAVLLGTFLEKDVNRWADPAPAPDGTNYDETVIESYSTVFNSQDTVDESTPPVLEVISDLDEKLSPHRNLTHALIFADKRKKEEFDDLLAGAVPEGVLLVGGTPHAFNEALDALRAGKQIFAFDGTGGAADLLSTLMNNRSDGEWSGPSAQECMSIATQWYQGLDGDDSDRLIRLHDWRTWPPDATRYAVLNAIGTVQDVHFRPNMDTVLVIDKDERDLTVQEKITAAILTPPESFQVGNWEDDRDLMMNGWSQWKVFLDNAETHRSFARLLYFPVIVLTFLTVLFATAEAQLKFRKEHKHYRNYLRYAVIIFPLVVALLVAMTHKWQPMTKWARLTLAARQIEGEIYKYRMRVGEYAPRRDNKNFARAFGTGDDANPKQPQDNIPKLWLSRKSPRACFSDRLAEIWDSVSASEVARGALQDAEHLDVNALETKLREVLGQHQASALTMKPIAHEDMKEDYIAPLRAQQYLNCRVYPKLKRRFGAAPRWNFFLGVLQFGIFLCTFAASLLAAFEAPLWVPVVIAFSAAISAFVAFELLTQRLNANNTSMATLKNLEIWWRGLTFIQRRHPAAKEILVQRTEEALILQIASISQLALRLDEKRALDGAYEDEDARGSRRSGTGKGSE